VQVATDLVSFTFSEGMALSTSRLEEIGTLLCVSCVVKSVSKDFSLSVTKNRILGASWRQRRKLEKRVLGFNYKDPEHRRYNDPNIAMFYAGTFGL
jgi:hypothetical protein